MGIPEKTVTQIVLPQGRIAVHRAQPASMPDMPKAPVLLLHEALGSITQWRDFPQVLADRLGRTVIAWDRLGHGASDPMPPGARGVEYLEQLAWTDMPAIVAELDLDAPPVLFGHSDGGSIALLYAARHDIAAVIAEAAHVIVEPETLTGIEAARAAWRETDLPRRLARHHGDKTEALFRAWSDTWTATWFRAWSIEEACRTIQAPTLVLQGAGDAYASVAHVERIRALPAGPAEGMILPDCRHAPHHENREAVLDAVCAFLIRHRVP